MTYTKDDRLQYLRTILRVIMHVHMAIVSLHLHNCAKLCRTSPPPCLQDLSSKSPAIYHKFNSHPPTIDLQDVYYSSSRHLLKSIGALIHWKMGGNLLKSFKFGYSIISIRYKDAIYLGRSLNGSLCKGGMKDVVITQLPFVVYYACVILIAYMDYGYLSKIEVA